MRFDLDGNPVEIMDHAYRPEKNKLSEQPGPRQLSVQSLPASGRRSKLRDAGIIHADALIRIADADTAPLQFLAISLL